MSISYSTQPNDQISVRLSIGLPRACSGLMYAAVPRITPSRVPPTVTVGDCERSGADPSPSDFREAEVEHLHHAFWRDLDVGGLQIPVNDPFFVRRVQRVRNLAGNGQRLVERQSSPRVLSLVPEAASNSASVGPSIAYTRGQE